MAFVFLLMHFSIRSGLILNDSGSISAKTGFAPVLQIDPTVAKNVKGDVITSSPSPIPNDLSARSSASVPEETPIACFVLQYEAKRLSNSLT